MRGIEYIVAPYEADAQLAYLSLHNIVDVIITEDSDLLAFGARRVLYKLDFQSMRGQEITQDGLRDNREPSLQMFTHSMFLTMCILAGCDYLPQVSGVGIKTAHKLVTKCRSARAALAELRRSCREKVPADYEARFVRAFLTFRLQLVYCPLKEAILSVNQIDVKALKAAIAENDIEALEDALLDPYVV
jgi:exonuclease-1